jgi:hypothetical protein
MDPRLARALTAWLIQRDARLGGRVRPEFEQPGGNGPFCVFTHVHTDRRGNLRTRTGQTKVRVQIDVWSRDHAVGAAVAQRIKGTGREADPAARGLDYFAGEWPDPAAPDEPVLVQFAELVDAFGDDAPPVGGTEEGWYRHSADYEITYEEW